MQDLLEQLEALATRVEQLIDERKQVLQENESLHLQISKLAQERAILMDKNQFATTKIRNIITQLREEMA